MDWADAINALFALGGAAMQWMNVQSLYRHKSIRGVWWPAWALFAAWGWWNVYYYGPHLDQWLSWGAGLLIVTANTLWVVMAIYYTYFYDVLVDGERQPGRGHQLQEDPVRYRGDEAARALRDLEGRRGAHPPRGGRAGGHASGRPRERSQRWECTI